MCMQHAWHAGGKRDLPVELEDQGRLRLLLLGIQQLEGCLEVRHRASRCKCGELALDEARGQVLEPAFEVGHEVGDLRLHAALPHIKLVQAALCACHGVVDGVVAQNNLSFCEQLVETAGLVVVLGAEAIIVNGKRLDGLGLGPPLVLYPFGVGIRSERATQAHVR